MKYEKLLAEDPIGAFEKIKQNYKRYYETTFKVRDKDIDRERIGALERDNNIYREPYLELQPEYQSADGTISDLAEDKDFQTAFGSEDIATEFFDFISRGLMNYPPYLHQIGMFKKSFVDKNNVVITSGTGSGKTEAFLLPLLADLFKEATTWGESKLNPRWYTGIDDNRYYPRQREDDSDDHIPALRTIILYPMNALVEDQMSRLREALDSDEVRKFMDNNLKGNRIFFGRYNSSTLGKKSYEIYCQQRRNLASEQTSLYESLNDIHQKYEQIRRHQDNGDSQYTVSRLDGNSATAEMVTRWDMQETPPDIMITNVSMLSIMLMRKAEKNIFAKTREWLQNHDHVFHIVIDEMHLYKGTAGSETAALLRMLLHEIGLEPVIDDGNGHKIPNPQLRILASSASLGTEDQIRDFFEQFFGVYSDDPINHPAFVLQESSSFEPQIDNDDDIDNGKFYGQFRFFNTRFNDSDNKYFVDLDDTGKGRKADEFAQKAGCSDGIEDFINNYSQKIYRDVVTAFYAKNEENALHKNTVLALSDIYGENKLFPDIDALRGFLIFRGYADTLNIQNVHLPRIKFHQFFKFIEGLWGELNPTIDDNGNPNNNSPVTNLSYTPQEVGPNRHKMLELLRCECCGSLYIGGNRKEDQGRTFLTLNYPDLNKIPSSNPTPMVQNKSMASYAIFYPSNENKLHFDDHDNDELHLSDFNGRTTLNDTNAKALWERGYLNVDTGEFVTNREKDEGYIQGFLLSYDIHNRRNGNPDLRNILALPCCCPYCRKDYQYRISVKSPIRSFRPGIDRNNQLLSKEIFYQLPDNNKKLIGFSDSREDAARQALGIETEHYRDMVRMLFVKSLLDVRKNMKSGIENAYNDYLEHINRNEDSNDISDMVRDELEEISLPYDTIKTIRKDFSHNNYNHNPQIYLPEFIPLKTILSKGDQVVKGTLLESLAKLGINPAGPESRWQTFRLNNTTYESWNHAFKNNGEMVQGITFQQDNDHPFCPEALYDKLSSAIFKNAFGQYMGVSILDSGIGYICCHRSPDIEGSKEFKDLDKLLRPTGTNTYDFIDAIIRMLGDAYRFKDPDDKTNDNRQNWIRYDDFRSSIRSKVRNFAALNYLDGENKNIGEPLFIFLYMHCTGNSTWLDIGNLDFKKFDDEDELIKCPICGRIHPNIGMGICTNFNCNGNLRDKGIRVKAKDLHNHFISYDILEEPREPIRLHTAELTGQTDKDEVQNRLLEFKGIILNDDGNGNNLSESLAKTIDMVNVTTTMEVGVDIGSLSAVYQGNMPPTRANYQQRAGRCGRRKNAFSAVITFCRGKSHDLYYYYKAPEKMVGGDPCPPTLTLSPFRDTDENGNPVYRIKQSIMRRVIVKELLHNIIGEQLFDFDLVDTCGEFGKVSQWETTKNQIQEWLRNNADSVEQVVNSYLSQFNRNNVDISRDINDIINWINNDMLTAIDNAVINENPEKGLAQCLSEKGLLPMYGMPTDLRSFYHGLQTDNNGQRRILSIDRSLEMSITEFAPGNIRTKDKGQYKVENLSSPMVMGNIGCYIPCPENQQADALKDSYYIEYDNNGEISSIDRFHEQELDNLHKRLVIPLAYSTNSPSDGNIPAAEDRRSSFSEVKIFAQDEQNGKNSTGPNFRLGSYGFGPVGNSEIWHVNSRKFYGRFDEVNHAWNVINNNGDHAVFRVTNDSNDSEIQIGEKKMTEMVKLELLKCPDCLNLNVNDQNCNKSAVHAAFYSAATILQRVLADKLDVDPDEIEISEKIGERNGFPIIYLNDKLPNGAGIVNYLSEKRLNKQTNLEQTNLELLINDIVTFQNPYAQSLIDVNHRKKCLTACQECMLNYNNRGLHHVLDWRLGLGILRLFINPDYDFGFNKNNRNNFQELSDYDDLLITSKRKIAEIPEDQREDNNMLITLNHLEHESFLVYHPLWEKQHVRDLFIDDEEKHAAAQGARMYNIFNLLRSNIQEDRYIQEDR